MDETAKKCFEALVDTLSLAVRLRMIRRTHVEGHTSKLKELMPKRTRENLVTITDDGSRQPMETVDFREEKLGDSYRSKWMTEAQKVIALTEFINYNQDTVHLARAR